MHHLPSHTPNSAVTYAAVASRKTPPPRTPTPAEDDLNAKISDLGNSDLGSLLKIIKS